MSAIVVAFQPKADTPASVAHDIEAILRVLLDRRRFDACLRAMARTAQAQPHTAPLMEANTTILSDMRRLVVEAATAFATSPPATLDQAVQMRARCRAIAKAYTTMLARNEDLHAPVPA